MGKGTKKVYRSLFDSDDVFEVEEITDDPEVSAEGVASVKKDSDSESTKGHTIEDCWGAIQKIADAVGCKLDGDDKGVKDACEPGEGNKVTKQNPTLDTEEEVEKEKKVDDSDEEKLGEGEEASKEVKDAYKPFTSVGEKKKVDTVHATQVAFQSRYDAVANK